MKVIQSYTKAFHKGKHIVLCWVPSHIGIRGNEEADRAANAALNEPCVSQSRKVVASDLKQAIAHTFDTLWQETWDNDEKNKLKQILPVIKKNKIPKSLSRKESSLYTRLKIWHTHLTHCYMLKGEPDPPFCIGCNETVTIKHLLVFFCVQDFAVLTLCTLDTRITARFAAIHDGTRFFSLGRILLKGYSRENTFLAWSQTVLFKTNHIVL